MKIYVSGPMTGIKDYNFPAFNTCAERLRGEGHEVVNPADTGLIDGWSWSDYLRYDIRLITECDAIHLLPGWEDSNGANLELHVAQALGLEVRREPGA